ncbi:hypothetical protein [Albidovulum sp.]|uniref:hypothetical protein n=1 Tax=Albidovulum sp. TaxID=1872424 RepID=UPI003D7EA248
MTRRILTLILLLAFTFSVVGAAGHAAAMTGASGLQRVDRVAVFPTADHSGTAHTAGGHHDCCPGHGGATDHDLSCALACAGVLACLPEDRATARRVPSPLDQRPDAARLSTGGIPSLGERPPEDRLS